MPALTFVGLESNVIRLGSRQRRGVAKEGTGEGFSSRWRDSACALRCEGQLSAPYASLQDVRWMQ